MINMLKIKIVILILTILLVGILVLGILNNEKEGDGDGNEDRTSMHKIEIVLSNPTLWYGSIATEERIENYTGTGERRITMYLGSGESLGVSIGPADEDLSSANIEIYDNGQNMNVPVEVMYGGKTVGYTVY